MNNHKPALAVGRPLRIVNAYQVGLNTLIVLEWRTEKGFIQGAVPIAEANRELGLEERA